MTNPADAALLLLARPDDPPDRWAAVEARLGASASVVPLAEAPAALGTANAILVGWGGGATDAALLARRAEDGETGLVPPARLVLIEPAFGADEATSRRIGVLGTPTTLVAAEAALDATLASVAPHMSRARIVRSDLSGPAIAAAIVDPAVAAAPPGEPAIDPAYAALIGSARVTARTRDVLRARAASPAPSPEALTPPALAILRATIAVLLPIAAGNETQVDIARRIDAALAAGGGDGWRYAALPPDRVAAERGIATLEAAAIATAGRPFLCLDHDARAALIGRGEAGELAGALDGAATALWLGELKREAVRQWMSHPATLGRLGYSGIGAVGGDRPDKRGFAPPLGPGAVEDWEPRAW